MIGFGWEPAAPSGLALATLGVDGFFVISGFLVARSHERLTLPRFAWHRFLRIMPGFWVCLVVTAFVVAPIAALLLERPVGTILRPPESALTHPLANLLLATPQTGISGLLTGSPAGDDTVNVPLWSLPFEAVCYGLLVLLAARTALRGWRRHLLVLTVVLLGLTVAKECGLPVPGVAGLLLELVTLFLLGALGHLYAQRVPANGWLAVAAAAVVAASILLLQDYRAGAAVAFAYVLLWWGLRSPVPFHPRADLSYGVYIYQWPVMSLFMLAGLPVAGSVVFLGVGLGAAALVATASWFLVERPALALKDMSFGRFTPGAARAVDRPHRELLPYVTHDAPCHALGGRLKIAWLIDVQAPYREPMYAAIARRTDFKVHFFFRDEKVRHWTWRDHPGYRSEVVPSFRVPLPGMVRRRVDDEKAILAPGVPRRILAGTEVLGLPGWDQPLYLGMALRARRRGIPYVSFYESTLRSRQFDSGPIAAARSWFFRHAGAVVVPGPAARAAAIASGASPDRVVESVNSIDLDAFGRQPRELRAASVGRGGPHRIAYVGQLIPRKNVHGLLDAVARSGADAVLEIAGDGIEASALRARAADLGIADRVRFLGFLDESGVVELLARTQTLVLPSHEEVYGMTALEAHVAGCQVVVSERAGVAESLAGRPGTWIVPPTVEGVAAGLDAACVSWSGWAQGVDSTVASPDRTAADVVRAAELALGRP